ncbi:MAG: DUF2079 domain-containing protein [Flavobacteriales bacterium]|nr:DUF2079 domain-containing protein [Flavobacteriales bacterium]
MFVKEMNAAWYSRRSTALTFLGVFALLYALIFVPNHALLRTYALDLGLYTHAAWHYAHFHMHDSTLFMEEPQPILADHFDLYLPLFSPLVHVFGTWTLLLVQWVALLVGAWGVRRFLLAQDLSPGMALLGMLLFLLFFGVFAAIAFDYHSNVVATGVLPWFLLALWRGRHIRALVLFCLMLVGKESMGLWLGPLALVLAFDGTLPRTTRLWAGSFGALGLAWSFVAIGMVMPALSAKAEYAHFDYSILGTGLEDVGRAIVDHSGRILCAFFSDHRGVENGTAIKLEFWGMLLLAGGWSFVLRPKWGLMALPLLAQKMLHDDPGKWSVVAHYGVEFAPLLAIAAPLTLSRLGAVSARKWLCVASLIGAFACTIRFMDRTVAYQDRSRIRFYQVDHYTKPYSVASFRRALDRIPEDATVSAQSPAVPHFALREHVYQFPLVRDAEHLVLLPKESPYPLDTTEYERHVNAILLDTTWQLVDSAGGVVYLKRLGRKAMSKGG